MAIIRQMAGLYLRGSIANITMAGLTSEQKQHIEELFAKVINHEELVRHKYKVMQELGVTIRSDYADDKLAAEQEFDIAVWRGLVSIFYHRSYNFECTNCNATTSLTQRGKPKPIDRLLIPCPACGKAVIDDPGVSEHKHGEIVDYREIQEKFKSQPYNTPTFRSCIRPIPQEKKHNNPNQVIECPKQLRKFFGEFIWNYFRQQIKENKRKEHSKKPIAITGPADQMIAESIISLCIKQGVDYNRHIKLESKNGKYTINISTLLTSPEFAIELACIKFKAETYGVTMSTTEETIEINECPDAPTISVSIIKSEHVTILDNQTTASNDEENAVFSINQVSHKTIGAISMDQDDHVAVVDLIDAANKTRESLPTGHCRSVYDIYCQYGPIYDQFSHKYGDGTPKINHIAEFLGITARAVKSHRSTIGVQCLANDFVPSTR